MPEEKTDSSSEKITFDQASARRIARAKWRPKAFKRWLERKPLDRRPSFSFKEIVAAVVQESRDDPNGPPKPKTVRKSLLLSFGRGEFDRDGVSTVWLQTETEPPFLRISRDEFYRIKNPPKGYEEPKKVFKKWRRHAYYDRFHLPRAVCATWFAQKGKRWPIQWGKAPGYRKLRASPLGEQPKRRKGAGARPGAYFKGFREWFLPACGLNPRWLDSTRALPLKKISTSWANHCKVNRIEGELAKLPEDRQLRDVVAKLQEEAIVKAAERGVSAALR